MKVKRLKGQQQRSRNVRAACMLRQSQDNARSSGIVRANGRLSDTRVITKWRARRSKDGQVMKVRKLDSHAQTDRQTDTHTQRERERERETAGVRIVDVFSRHATTRISANGRRYC